MAFSVYWEDLDDGIETGHLLSAQSISQERFKTTQVGGIRMAEIDFLTDKSGQTKAVVIPIDLWRKILPDEEASVEEISDALEDYCLNKAMDEAKKSPLLDRDEALTFLKE